MYIEIRIKSISKQIELLKTNRFFFDRNDNDLSVFKRSIDYQDLFIEKQFMTDTLNLICKEKDPKYYNQLIKLELEGKSPFSSIEKPTKKFLELIDEISKLGYVDFAYSEEFSNLPNQSVSLEEIKKTDFEIQFGKRFIVLNMV